MSDARATLLNEDFFGAVGRVREASVDLVIADPPYGLGKDYGNDSDRLSGEAYLEFSRRWIDAVIPKLKPAGSLYVFLTWQYSPEVFSYLKTRLVMVNEIIWDRKVPSMGGSTRKFSSVHDTIGLFARSKDYYFDIDGVRIPYDAATKRARTRSIFVTGRTRSARSILRRSRSKSSSAWCWRAVRRKDRCSIRSWEAAPPLSRRSGTAGVISDSRSIRNTALLPGGASRASARRTPELESRRVRLPRRCESSDVANPVDLRETCAAAAKGAHTLCHRR